MGSTLTGRDVICLSVRRGVVEGDRGEAVAGHSHLVGREGGEEGRVFRGSKCEGR